MKDGPPLTHRALDPELLSQLGALDPAAALAVLAQAGCNVASTVAQLAQAALHQAETDPRLAAHWLTIATALNAVTGDDATLLAQVEYAQARLYAHTGDLAAAEAALRRAQIRWQAADDQAALTRSYLGLTGILARQGRYAEAEMVIRQAIDALTAQPAVEAPFLQLIRARDNLATLLSYQDRHREALEEYTRVQQNLEAYHEQLHELNAEMDEARLEVAALLALNELNRSTSLTYLDRHEAAELALQRAIAAFSQLKDQINRARAYINLGILYLRTGRYAAALTQFDLAAAGLTRKTAADESDLVADDDADLHQADRLLLELERATAYIALNLVPEATTALDRCVLLYRNSNQPYELGQALFALGMVHLRTKDYREAAKALGASEQTFATLQNVYWIKRTSIALAYLAYQQGDIGQTRQRLSDLPAVVIDPEPVLATGVAAATPSWDIGTLVDGYLLQLRLQLDQRESRAARHTATYVQQLIGGALDETLPTAEIIQQPLPHLQLRLRHALGRIEWLAGNHEQAQLHFATALALLEAQRITLPLEEIRTAFVDDKTDIYNDLMLVQLAEPGFVRVAAAFATLERARSRTLLERLLATGELAASSDGDAQLIAQREEVRQELHWLYNRLFGDAEDRRADSDLKQAIQTREAQLQQLEWRTSPLLLQSQPIDLAMLQAALDPDQQALCYTMAGDEVFAFLVDHQQAQVFRRLCTVAELQAAQAELDFQLGRAELGSAYLARHAVRLQTALQTVLYELYRLLVAPMTAQLDHPRLLLIPYGSLHLLPFHALWDGQQYLVERFEFTYAPSAGVAVHCQTVAQPASHFTSFAGLAVGDATIPQAMAEVETAARYFDAAWVYLGAAANQAGLQQAAQQADILHLATHGLFRPDNPFFSALKLADGWIDVRQLYRLPLAARLVVLSACQSGAGRVQGGDEVIGLVRGFLSAGAHALMVSLWNVHDESAVHLMADFYRHLTTPGSVPTQPAAALRAAQLAAIQRGQHPYFWAPFLVIGLSSTRS
ncbi:MAG: CHAT domain-containing protein [Chloroflexi bacterium]|nr:CHAT domain-containing protein [Chloroflexota bacterium]